MASASYTPLEAPLSPTPDDPVFTDLQWDTLLSLSDVIIPAWTTEKTSKASYQKTVTPEQFDSTLSALTQQIKTPDAAEVARQYLTENASSNPLFKEGLRRAFALYVHQDGKKGLSLILSVLK